MGSIQMARRSFLGKTSTLCVFALGGCVGIGRKIDTLDIEFEAEVEEQTGGWITDIRNYQNVQGGSKLDVYVRRPNDGEERPCYVDVYDLSDDRLISDATIRRREGFARILVRSRAKWWYRLNVLGCNEQVLGTATVSVSVASDGSGESS